MSQAVEVVWQPAGCLGCGDGASACPRHAIRLADGRVHVDRTLCQACGTCVEACPAGALERIGIEYTVDELLVEVLKDRTFYETSGGGVTFSGGEPLMQHEFLPAFAPRCRAEGFHFALDTSGFARPEWLAPVLECIDLVLFDLKVMDHEAHLRMTGAPLEPVLANLGRVAAAGLPIWIRTPVIPGYTDDEQNLRGIAAYLKAHVPTLERYDLLAFSNLCTAKYEMLGRKFELAAEPLLSPETMERLTDVVRNEGIDVVRWSGPTTEVRGATDQGRSSMEEALSDPAQSETPSATS